MRPRRKLGDFARTEGGLDAFFAPSPVLVLDTGPPSYCAITSEVAGLAPAVAHKNCEQLGA